MKRLSIITVAGADPSAIEQTRQSLAKQNYASLEHIVIDQAASGAAGVAAARNDGLRQVSGDVVAYLDPGDCYEPGAVEIAMRHFTASAGCRVLYGRAWLRSENDLLSSVEYPTQPWDYERLQCEQLCCLPAMFFRRDVASKFGVFDERLEFAFEYDYCLRIGANVPFVYEPDTMLASCRQSIPGFLRRGPIRALEETLEMLSAHATSLEPLHYWLRLLAAAVGAADCSQLRRDFDSGERYRRAYATALLGYGDIFEIPVPQDELVLLLSGGGTP